MNRDQLLQLAAELTRRREPFVQAVVVARRPPSSARVGDRAVITAGGAFHGWLGGSCIRPTVLAEARRALADGEPRLVAIDPDPEAARRPGVAVFPMTCHSGGSVEIYLEPVLPSPALVVFGLSPVARALARLGAAMGYRVTVADPEAEAGAVPEAERVVTDYAEAGAGGGGAPGLYAVVATMGEDDEGALRAALGLGAAYLGLVASARRFAAIRETLLARGVDAAALERVRSPAGLDLGARSPEEIALSVLAEVVQLRRAEASAAGVGEAGEAASPGAETRGSTGGRGPAGAPAQTAGAPVRATDPVCGMSVEVAGARHSAEHGGETFYFCCGGCRERFLAEPERYTAGDGGPHGRGGVKPEIAALLAAMEREGYVADPAIATAVYLAREMRRPLLVEGDAGVGKTELAKVLARLLDTELIRLQCYEGLDVSTALYEWNYQRQLLRLRLAEDEGKSPGEIEELIFGRSYLLERPLLRAITREEGPPVLLIDEIDRADEGFEAFLLEVLSDFQVTIPELGTIRAAHVPHVVLTSNRTREIGDALRRRCLYLYIEHPTVEKEVRVLHARVPGVGERLALEIARFMRSLRERRLSRAPGVAETIDWARALLALHHDRLEVEAVVNTLGCLLKDPHDLREIRDAGDGELAALVAAAREPEAREVAAR